MHISTYGLNQPRGRFIENGRGYNESSKARKSRKQEETALPSSSIDGWGKYLYQIEYSALKVFFYQCCLESLRSRFLQVEYWARERNTTTFVKKL